MRYRRRSILVEALQFDGTAESAREILEWINVAGAMFIPSTDGLGSGFISIPIPHEDCDYLVKAGNYFVSEAKGLRYICKPEHFDETYEAALDEQT